MKFLIDITNIHSARTGTLTGFERMPDAVFETPLLLIYTKAGSIPHLTKDVWRKITTEDQVLSVSLPSTITMADYIKEVNNTFAEFVSMKEHLNFLAIQDPAYATNSGYKQKDTISIWSKIGRHMLTADKYMDIVEIFKPDIYVTLCDGDTSINSSTKRVAKAVERTRILLEQCLKRHSASDTLKSKAILGAVEGGYDLKARERSIMSLRDKPVAGFLIDGLHANGPNVRNILPKQIKDIVTHILNLLPAEKLKVIMGCWNPVTVLELIELGIDVFDSSYAYTAVEQSQALTFLCDNDCCNNTAVISITNKQYTDDFTPICSKCPCLTCTNHTKAYIHHLYYTKEMLGPILLTIHNMHHYLEFFKTIRKSIKNNTFKKLQVKVNDAFSKTDDCFGII